MEAPNTAPVLSTEPLDVVNKRLADEFGLFDGVRPNYRLVWSEDQYENRLGEYPRLDNSGNYLGMVTGFQFVAKYKQWMPRQWVLEMLIPVPEHNNELTGKLTYEPLHGFINAYNGKHIDPTYRAIQFMIKNLQAQAAKKNKVEYKDPLIDQCDPKISFEVNEARIKSLMTELFGNENDNTDALAYKEGVTVPNNYNKTSDNILT